MLEAGHASVLVHGGSISLHQNFDSTNAMLKYSQGVEFKAQYNHSAASCVVHLAVLTVT